MSWEVNPLLAVSSIIYAKQPAAVEHLLCNSIILMHFNEERISSVQNIAVCGPTSAPGCILKAFFVNSQAIFWEVIISLFSISTPSFRQGYLIHFQRQEIWTESGCRDLICVILMRLYVFPPKVSFILALFVHIISCFLLLVALPGPAGFFSEVQY